MYVLQLDMYPLKGDFVQMIDCNEPISSRLNLMIQPSLKERIKNARSKGYNISYEIRKFIDRFLDEIENEPVKKTNIEQIPIQEKVVDKLIEPIPIQDKNPIVKRILNERQQKFINAYKIHIDTDDKKEAYLELKERAKNVGCREQLDQIIIDHDITERFGLILKMDNLVIYHEAMAVVDKDDKEKIKQIELERGFRQFLIDQKHRDWKNTYVNIGLLKYFLKEDDEELLLPIIKDFGFTEEYKKGIYIHRDRDIY